MTQDASQTYQLLQEKLHDVLPDFEIRAKAELACRINQLKSDLGAVILGHNYMEPGLYHSVPDFTGDLPGAEPPGCYPPTATPSCSAESASWRRPPRS